MSLRRKLIYLHTSFAAFAVVTATSAIYGVQLHVREAIGSFEELIDESNLVEHLRVAAQAQLVELSEIVHTRRDVSSAYLLRRDAFFSQLTELASFAAKREPESTWWSVLGLGRSLRKESDRCLELTRTERWEQAETLLASQNLRYLWGSLDARLETIKNAMDDTRQRSVNRVLRTNTQLLGLAGLICITCAGLVIVGSTLVRRWFIAPVGDLKVATDQFAQGNLTHRVELRTDDELGSLGSALNEMASSLSVSEAKYRSLFENLKDAVILCAPDGTIVECRDSDTELLGIAVDQAIGGRLPDIWCDWRSSTWDWRVVVTHVSSAGERVHAVDVELPGPPGRRPIADVIAYPVEYSGTRHTAIVLRDVTERYHLQRLVTRAETMEAAETFARGVAHDFKNLLNSAVITLSLIQSETDNPKDVDRLQTALWACRQATTLSRRLLSFASSDEGSPQVFDLSETVELILSSLDEPFLAPLRIQTDCARSIPVRIDRDHLTQVILNLIRNAREAMADGGSLRISTDSVVTTNPISTRAPARHAVLTVSDTGCGMTTEVKERLFEPLFTTKARDIDGARGMGLAVVYAAVRNANGFIHVDSEVDVGTTFRVFLPGG